MSLPITPETRVGALLEAYPGIDEVLIRLVPAFAKLRNPILRKTVAKVATLEHAARVGGVSVRDLVRKLREETGQTVESLAAETPTVHATPAWAEATKIRATMDADTMLEAGTHPLGVVRKAAEELPPGEALLLTSSFRPEPLIGALANAGFAVYSRATGPSRHETLIVGRGPKRGGQ